MPEESRENLINAYKNHEFDFLSDYFYNMIRSYTGGVYAKNYGFNANRVEDQGYIEFRYPGHVLKKEDITNLTLYYAYIIKLSLDPSFKLNVKSSTFIYQVAKFKIYEKLRHC